MMKKCIFTIVAALAISAVLPVFAQDLYVATYNLRNNRNDDAAYGNGWSQRLPYALGLVDFEQPDVFAVQEMFADQLDDILAFLPAYAYTGNGRDDGKSAGEHCAIFYNKAAIELLDHGDFWLSEHPDSPGLGWDAVCPRICSWGKFRDLRSDEVFYFFNLHMDHVGVTARREGARLVVDRMKAIVGDAPAILTGDFNVDQTDEIYTIFTDSGLRDSYMIAGKRLAPNGTYNAFDPRNYTHSRIDHVFLTPQLSAERYAVLTCSYWAEDPSAEDREAKDAPKELRVKTYTERLPSDHYPVFVRLRINK